MAGNVLGDSSLLSDFVQERYLPFVQENKRSWKADKSNLERHILPHLGAYRLNDISADILKSWVSTLELTGLSYSSCFRLFWLAKYVLNCAVRWGVLASDAAFKAANLPAQPSRRPVLLGAEDVLRLLDILKTYRHRAAASAIHLMLLTGASKSEILYARWEDVDFVNGTLVTNKTFTGRPHLIPLNNEALKLIHSLPRRDDVSWLFFTRNGTRLSSITREWYQIREQLGRPELRLQDLRHSFANFLVSIGINQRDLRTILGHYKPETLALVRNNILMNNVRAL
ncbi:tyrosine-type recombinase/integrase [Mailhella sp.]|uniref:tyrosine-type recombinase/integrase n=1 Tax=Mailhella sp. TaxID=1981029 RepID=UPI004062F452